jgi:hypothetical protein
VSDPRGLVALLGLDRQIVSEETGSSEIGRAIIR